MGRCKGKSKSGGACRAPATSGGLCYFHAHPDQARILGQKGGRRKRYQAMDVAVPQELTMEALASFTDQAIGELLAGRMDPRVAGAFSNLVNTRRRLNETVELERRLSQLERKVDDQSSAAAAATATTNGSSVPVGIGNEEGSGNGSGGEDKGSV